MFAQCLLTFHLVIFSLVTPSCPTLCNPVSTFHMPTGKEGPGRTWVGRKKPGCAWGWGGGGWNHGGCPAGVLSFKHEQCLLVIDPPWASLSGCLRRGAWAGNASEPNWKCWDPGVQGSRAFSHGRQGSSPGPLLLEDEHPLPGHWVREGPACLAVAASVVSGFPGVKMSSRCG